MEPFDQGPDDNVFDLDRSDHVEAEHAATLHTERVQRSDLVEIHRLLVDALGRIEEHPDAPLPEPTSRTTHLHHEDGRSWCPGAMWELNGFRRGSYANAAWNVQVPDDGADPTMVFIHTPSDSHPSDVLALYAHEARRLALMLLAAARRAETDVRLRQPMLGRQPILGRQQ